MTNTKFILININLYIITDFWFVVAVKTKGFRATPYFILRHESQTF